MQKQETIIGTVIEAYPNTLFKIRLEDGRELKAHLAGKMRLFRIKVLIGDRVELVLDPYGTLGRIVRRI